MRPVLFELGGVRVYSHGFFLVLGLLVCVAVLVYEARRRRWPAHEVLPITLAAFVGGVLGARLAMLIFAGPDVAPVVFDYFALFDPSIGPGSILGGVAGAYGLPEQVFGVLVLVGNILYLLYFGQTRPWFAFGAIGCLGALLLLFFAASAFVATVCGTGLTPA